MTKDERQEISCNKWRDAKGRGTLNLIMRFGKTRVAAMIVGKLVKANPNRTIMAIAPNAVTTKNLVDNLTEFCPKEQWIDIMSSNTLINHVNKLKIERKLPIKVDLLILDEVHKLLQGETLIAIKNGEPKRLGKTSLKKLAIEGIKNGTYKYLFTAQSLNEGLTIENIEQVITTGGSCNSNTHGQRVARGKTYNYMNPNKNCVIINLYIDDFKNW